MTRRRSSAAERESREHARREKLTQLHEQLASGVEALMTGGEWQRWLSVAKRFYDYSFWNTVAIYRQRPDAEQVAGYKAWQALGRQVREGETGIRIIAPIKRRVVVDGDEGQGQGHQDNDEPTTVQRLSGFMAASVFDISQTDGEPIPAQPKPRLLTGDGPAGVWDALAAQITAAGYAIEVVGADVLGKANGRTMPGQVLIRDDLEPLQAAKTLAHERAHIALGHLEATCYADDRSRCEVEAESVAYLVLGSVDVDTTSYSFPYVAGWANGDVEVVREVGARVVELAHAITADLPFAPAVDEALAS